MGTELTTQVEETEEQFGKRLNLAKSIVNREPFYSAIEGELTDAEIRGRLLELETRANWYVISYDKMNHAELWDYFLQVKKEICDKKIKPNFWEK